MSSSPSTSLSSLRAEYDRSVSKCKRLKEELADKEQELSDKDHELALTRRRLERADRKHARVLEELKDDFKRQRSSRPAKDEMNYKQKSLGVWGRSLNNDWHHRHSRPLRSQTVLVSNCALDESRLPHSLSSNRPR